MGAKINKWDLMMECAREVQQPFSTDMVFERIMVKHLDREFSIYQVRKCLSLLVKKGQLEYVREGYDGERHSTFTQYKLKDGGLNAIDKGEREHVRLGDAHLVDTAREMSA